MRALIVCNAGVTAAVCAERVMREVARHGVAATVEASGLDRALAHAPAYDVVMLAPQVAYTKRDFEKVVASAGTFVCDVPSADYTRLHARKIADDLLSAAGE